MKLPVILSKFRDDLRRLNLNQTKEFDKEFDEKSKKYEIVLEQDLKYRYSCIIDKLELLKNQEKLDAELDSKN